MNRFSQLLLAFLVAGAGLSSASALASSLTTVYTAMPSGDGSQSSAPLTELDGVLYGTTGSGGIAGRGTVFKLDPATGVETVVYSFRSSADAQFPFAGLTSLGSMLYGTTQYSGSVGGGTIYKFDPATSAEAVIHVFSGNDITGQPSFGTLTAVGNILYGTAAADIFSADPTSGTVTVLARFPSAQEYSVTGGLLPVGQDLYGVTRFGGNGHGAIFKFNITTSTLQTVYKFTDVIGNEPYSPLVAIGRKLYGVTVHGGTGDGNIFELDLDTGTAKSVYAFADKVFDKYMPANLVTVNGLLYGTTPYGGAKRRGIIFEVDPTTGAETTLHDFTGSGGSTPYDALILSGSLLYGTTYAGGINGGEVFSVSPSDGAFTTPHVFRGPELFTTNANNGLLATKGSIYATITNSGTYSAGEVVKIDENTGSAAIVYNFTGGGDGNYPIGALVSHGDKMFGTTTRGGAYDLGTAFSLNSATGPLTTLHSFHGGKDGALPVASLVFDGVDLFGTTLTGGEPNTGTIFKLTPGGKETVLHAFTGGTDGVYPRTSMIGVGGKLYGTTSGTVASVLTGETLFSLDPATGVEIPVANLGTFFGGPLGGLSDFGGLIFGTTSGGGTYSAGKIFSFDPASHTLKTAYDFQGTPKDLSPETNLVSLGNILYGTSTSGGTSNCGTIFSFNPATGTEKVLYSFSCEGLAGYGPAGSLIRVGNALYGITTGNEANFSSTVFKFVP